MSPSKRRINDLVLELKYKPVKKGWEQWHLLCADVHLDHPTCERKLLTRHLNEAQDRNAPVFFFGDTFNATGGKFDKRRNRDDIQDEHNVNDWTDALVEDGAAFLKKWKDSIVLISLGNHEEKVLDDYGTNIARRLASQLDAEYFDYAGYVRFRMSGKMSHRANRLLYFHHGAGGGGEVTRGVIKTNRRQVYQPDPDIIVSGHIHEEWLVPVPRMRVSATDVVHEDKLYHVQLPTYMREWTGKRGFHMRREAPPKPIGAWWLILRYNGAMYDNIEVNFQLAQ